MGVKPALSLSLRKSILGMFENKVPGEHMDLTGKGKR
jgi:hypothetical protein